VHRDVVLVRGRENDSAIYRYLNALKANDISARLILWNRNKDNKVPGTIEDIVEIAIRSPTDSLRVAFYLPLWWLVEFIQLIRIRPRIIGAFDIDTAIPALLASKILGAKLTYVMLDYSPDCVPPSTSKILVKIMRGVEDLIMQSADRIVLVDETRIEQVNGGKYTDKISIVHNMPLIKINTDHHIETRSPSDIVSLFYAGILHETRGIKTLIESITAVDGLMLTIAGMGPMEDFVKTKASEHPDKIKYIGQINHDEVMRHTSSADAIIGFYDPNIRNNRYASPNRFFEAMMLSKPLITNKNISIAIDVQKFNSGYVVEYGNIDALQQTMSHIVNNRSELTVKGANANELLLSRYSIENEKRGIISAFTP